MAHDAKLESLLPPRDHEAELDLLGSVLRDNSTLSDAAREVEAGDFYDYARQRLWRAILRVSFAGKPIDPVILWNDLEAAGDTRDIRPEFIIEIFQNAPSAANAVHYARIVRQKSKLRKIIHAAQEMEREARGSCGDADAIVSRAAEIVFGLSDSCASKTVGWEDALREALEVIDRRAGKSRDGETENGLLTGWPKLDLLTGGMHKKDLIILAARPSVGKTLAAVNMINAIASEGHVVFFASLEQSRTDIVHRILSSRSGLNSHKFRTGKFSEFDGNELIRAVDAVKSHKVWINDGAAQPLLQVVSEARRLKMRAGLDMVVVDYLGLMQGERRFSENRSGEIGRLTRGLKSLAKDLEVVVLCLAQLNRGPEYRAGGKPRLADLRDSGEIEQDADTVFMLHKPEEKDAERETDKLDWLIEKQRNGPVGEIAMIHHKRTFTLSEETGSFAG